MRLYELYKLGRENLKKHNFKTPVLEAHVLLSRTEIIDNLSEIYSHPEKEVDQNSYDKFFELLKRRINREPIAYLVGEKEFYSKRYKVSPYVLIPRPETELLVEVTLELTGRFESPDILDMGTGSGCIAVTLASECERANIIASDISERALNIACENINYHNQQNMVSTVTGDLLSIYKDHCFDIIVSNPPYISEAEMNMLDSDVKYYEPNLALIAGNDGLKYIKEIISGSRRVLKNGGWCVLEIGKGQAEKVTALFSDAGYSEISALKDLNNIDRVIKAIWKK